jgi:hypothetical protein
MDEDPTFTVLVRIVLPVIGVALGVIVWEHRVNRLKRRKAQRLRAETRFAADDSVQLEVKRALAALLPNRSDRFVLYLRPFWFDWRYRMAPYSAMTPDAPGWEAYLATCARAGGPPIVHIGERNLDGLVRLSPKDLRSTTAWEEVLRALAELAWRVVVVPLVERGSSVGLEVSFVLTDAWRMLRKTIFLMPSATHLVGVPLRELASEWRRAAQHYKARGLQLGTYDPAGGLVMAADAQRPRRILPLFGGAPPPEVLLEFLRTAPRRDPRLLRGLDSGFMG